MTLHSASEIIDAVARRLEAAGVGVWGGADAPVPPGDTRTRIWAKHHPPETPSLTLNVYSISLSPNSEQPSTYRVQVLARAEGNADNLADAAKVALHGAHRQEWAGINVARCAHISTAQLGLDGLTDERTDNYEIII